jgi:hypothetical protein
LDSEKTYYLGDTEWLDDPRVYGSIVNIGVSIFQNVMTPGLFACGGFHHVFILFMSLSFSLPGSACVANVKEQFCHSIFKECAEVDGFFLPALPWYVQVYTHGQFCHSIFKECAEVDGFFLPALPLKMKMKMKISPFFVLFGFLFL